MVEHPTVFLLGLLLCFVQQSSGGVRCTIQPAFAFYVSPLLKQKLGTSVGLNMASNKSKKKGNGAAPQAGEIGSVFPILKLQ